MSIYISGSLAYDRIMTFPGHFTDHIIQDKLHVLNISFMVDRMEEKRGGCAGNIAYTLALLGEAPLVLASVGRDFKPYADFMRGMRLPLDGITEDEELFTALCYITTDLKSNQITGFYPGAMSLPCKYSFPHLDSRQDLAIVSPGNTNDMRALPSYFKEKGVRYIYDPGQQLPVLTGDDLLAAINGSLALTSNDYELDMIAKATGKTRAEIQGMTEWLITTYGEKGTSVQQGDTRVDIAAVPPARLADPTGAGDAHRAGILKGLTLGMSMPEAVRIGATCASFAIEEYGTQLHSFDQQSFMTRHRSVFGEPEKALW